MYIYFFLRRRTFPSSPKSCRRSPYLIFFQPLPNPSPRGLEGAGTAVFRNPDFTGVSTPVVWFTGGKTGSSYNPSDASQVLDVATLEWSDGPAVPYHGVMAALLDMEDGRALMVGGYNGYDLSYTRSYDFKTKQWSSHENVPRGREGHKK